jgi:hypothetical protein
MQVNLESGGRRPLCRVMGRGLVPDWRPVGGSLKEKYGAAATANPGKGGKGGGKGGAKGSKGGAGKGGGKGGGKGKGGNSGAGKGGTGSKKAGKWDKGSAGGYGK